MMKKFLYFVAYALYFATPFESVVIVPGVSVVKLTTVFFLGAALLCYPKTGIPKNSFIVLFLIYTVLTILSVLWSIDRPATLQSSIGTILPSFIVTLFLYRLIQSKAHLTNIFKAYAFGATIASVYALYKFFTIFRFAGPYYDEARLVILGQDPNELSFLLSFGIVSVLYLLHFIPLKKLKKIGLILSAVMMAFIVLSTGSRTGFVMVLSIGFVVMLMYVKSWRVIFIIPVIIGLGIVLFHYLPESIVGRLFDTSEAIRSGAIGGRSKIWLMGWDAFLSEGVLLFGTGFKTFPSLMFNYFSLVDAPHNTFLSSFIELGLVGFVIYASMLGVLIKKVVALCKCESVYFSLLLLPLLLAMMTLGLEGRRWLFLIAVLILKLWQFYKIEQGHVFKKYRW